MSEVSHERLFLRLSAADDALSRLDERVSACPYRPGYVARRDFAEAVAWSWTQGSVTSLEDLVLLARRKASIGGPGLLSVDGVDWLRERRRKPPIGGLVTRHPPPR